MATRKLRLLFSVWIITYALGLVFGGLSAQGILRASRFGEPVIHVDLSKTSDWIFARFRVWGAGTYLLFISTVNHDSTHVGAPFTGEFEVAIIDPYGKVLFQQVYASESIDHRLPQNYGDTRLNLLDLDDWPLWKWTLKARVLKPDLQFRTGRSEIKFWKQRYDPGMGGLIYFVMIVPAGFFLVVAALCAAGLARSGSKIPLGITLIPLIAYLWLLV